MPYKDRAKKRAADAAAQRRRRQRLRQAQELGTAGAVEARAQRMPASPPAAEIGPTELFLAGRLVGWIEILAEYGRPDWIDWEQIHELLRGRRSVEVMVRHKLLELGLGELLERAL